MNNVKKLLKTFILKFEDLKEKNILEITRYLFSFNLNYKIMFFFYYNACSTPITVPENVFL